MPFIEGWIALAGLVLVVVALFVLWADAQYQDGRRQQRLRDRGLQ